MHKINGYIYTYSYLLSLYCGKASFVLNIYTASIVDHCPTIVQISRRTGFEG